MFPRHSRREEHLPIRPGEIKQPLWMRNWQWAQNQRVNQQEGGGACAQRERQRQRRRTHGRAIFPQHAAAEADVLKDRLEPADGSYIMAGFPQQQTVSEPTACVLLGVAPVHAASHQALDALFQMKSDFLVKLEIKLIGAKYIDETRYQGHIYALRSTWPTAAVMASQRSCCSMSCFRPATVISYRRARRLFWVVIHFALTQPHSSSRCSAGYSEPSSTQ